MSAAALLARDFAPEALLDVLWPAAAFEVEPLTGEIGLAEALGRETLAGAALSGTSRGSSRAGWVRLRDGRPALGLSRLGIAGFDLTLVIWRSSAGLQGAPGREVYSF